MSSWLHERAAVVATVDPQSLSTSELFCDDIDMSKFSEVMAVLSLGDCGNQSCTFRAVEGASASPTTAISGKSKARTASASANDNAQDVISVKAEELLSTTRYVRFGVVSDGSLGSVSVVVLGVPRFLPATDDKLSSCATPVF